MLLPDPTSSWLFKPINSRILSKDAMLDEHPSLCELWPKLFFSLTEELSPKACQSQLMSQTTVLLCILFGIRDIELAIDIVNAKRRVPLGEGRIGEGA